MLANGFWPWIHFVLIESKNHWSILLPVIATVATWLLLKGKTEESQKWWTVFLALIVLLGIINNSRVVELGVGLP